MNMKNIFKPLSLDEETWVKTCEAAAAAPHKNIKVDYENVTDKNEIRRIFKMEKVVECWETSCLYNSACDTFENDGKNPYCLECKEDCPNKIVIDF